MGKASKQTVLGRVPACVIAYFSVHGVAWEDALVVLRSDMGMDGTDRDCFVLLTKDAIYRAEGVIAFAPEKGVSRSRRVECFEADAPVRIPLSEVKEARVELLISSGRAICERNGETEQLFAFSATYHHDATVFCRALTEWQETGEISDRLLKDEDISCKVCPKCGRRFPERGRRFCPNCIEKRGLTVRLAKLFFRYKKYLLLIFATLLLNVGLNVLSPYIGNKVLYQDVLFPGNSGLYGQIGLLVLVMVGMRLLSLVVSLITNVVNAKVAAEITCQMKTDIFGTLGRLSLSFFSNRQTGSLMTQINSDATTIYWFLIDGFPMLLSQSVLMLAVLGAMFTLNVELTLYTCVTIPLFFFSFHSASMLFEKMHARTWSKRASYNSLIADVINGIRVVKAFSREEAEQKRFDARSTTEAEAVRQMQTVGGLMYPTLQFVMKIGSYVVWLIGGLRVMGGEMDFATLMTFTAYFTLIFGPIEMLSDITDWWSECLNSLKRLFDIQDAKVEVAEAEHPLDPELKGEVEFKNVSFSYVENRKVLTDISFHIPAGKTLGIVGQTGAGKSTLANLLTRLYDCDEGEILLDGTDIRLLSFACLHRSIAIVSQETYLFNGTVLENIRYARPEATFDEVVAAAAAAHAHEFIMKFPDGYQTRIGQGARQLSGGEKQRISIARALLKDPKILILDEATSAMDTQTERDIQKALTALSRERTTVMIAHRLSTLRDADRLIAIADGKLAEAGTAEELMARKGVYYKLYTLQAEALRNVLQEDHG